MSESYITRLLAEAKEARDNVWRAKFRAVEDAIALLYTISGYDGDVLDNAIESLRAEAEANLDMGGEDTSWSEGIFDRLGRE